MNILKFHKEITENCADTLAVLNKMDREQKRRERHIRARSIPTINCESWTIVRPATDADNSKARNRIINR